MISCLATLDKNAYQTQSSAALMSIWMDADNIGGRVVRSKPCRFERHRVLDSALL